MITLENLKEMLKEKEALKKQTETIYMQVMGQIQLLNSMIQKEETPTEVK
jgi:hypothetical protein